MRDNALFERIGRSRGGSQLTHECIGQQSLLHSTGSDPAPTVAHVLPLDSSEAPLASTPRAAALVCGSRPGVPSGGSPAS